MKLMIKNDINTDFYSIIIFDMLKTDPDSVIKIYNEIKEKPINIIDTLQETVLILCKSNLITENMVKNIDILLTELVKDFPVIKNYIIFRVNRIKAFAMETKFDQNEVLMLDDIYKRYFGIDNALIELIYNKKVVDFCVNDYYKVMSDIAFDVEVIKYLLNDEYDVSNLIYNEQFINSIRYIYMIKRDLFEDENIRNKIRQILLINRENLDKNNKGLVNANKKMLKSIDRW